MRKRFACLLVATVLLAMCLFPVTAAADGEKAAPYAWIGETQYETLEAAVNAAESGATITLGEGQYTLYKKGADTKGKDLTFVGQGVDKTIWQVGAAVPDEGLLGTEYNGDYSFDGSKTVKFQNMKLQSGTVNYLGFIRADDTIVENCTIDGLTFYWGYASATFRSTTFNAPDGDYAIWTYSSPVMTFDGCTFNSSGKTVNVYNEGGGSAANLDITFKNCTVNSSKYNKAVMNINDSHLKNVVIHVLGGIQLNGTEFKPDGLQNGKTEGNRTCSRLYEFNGTGGSNNTGKTTVYIDDICVWQNGKMVNHANSDGHKDNAYDVTQGEWEKQGDGSYLRSVKRVCQYCGYTEEERETGYLVRYDLNGGTATEGVDYAEAIVVKDTLIAAKTAPTRSGYSFTGWKIGDAVVQSGDTVTVSAPTVLVAQWQEQPSYTPTPVYPDYPEETTTPSQPAPTPSAADADVETSPKTGDADNAPLIVAMACVLLGAAMFAVKLCSAHK